MKSVAMRRPEQALSNAVCQKILQKHHEGVLALIDADGQPYAVPLNYWYHDNTLYFHGAPQGHKMSAVAANPQGSFCVIDRADIHAAEFTTYFKSVIAFGPLTVVHDIAEIKALMQSFGNHYLPQHEHTVEAFVDQYLNEVAVFYLKIETLTGKQASGVLKEEKLHAAAQMM